MVTLDELLAEGEVIRMEEQEREAKLYREYRSFLNAPEPAKTPNSAIPAKINPSDPTPQTEAA